MPQMNRRELLALGIAIPFTTVTYGKESFPKESVKKGYLPYDTDDRMYDLWLDDYDKDMMHLDENEIVR